MRWLKIFFALIFIFLLVQIFQKPNGILVLNYHQINSIDTNALTITPEDFAKEMDYLQEAGYETISAETFAQVLQGNTANLPAHPVFITFDDGYQDNFTEALPILEARNMKATIFVVPGFVSIYKNYLTWDQIHEMSHHDTISFGSHSLSHEKLTNFHTDEEIFHELAISKRDLELHTQKPVYFLAYPCGFYDEKILALTKKSGYVGAFTIEFGVVHPEKIKNPFALPRIPVFRSNINSSERFALRVNCPNLVNSLEHFRTFCRRNNLNFIANLIPYI